MLCPPYFCRMKTGGCITGDLSGKGFVEFQDNPNHQRSKLAVLNKGRNVLDKVTEMQIEWSNTVSKGLSVTKINSVIQTIRAIGDRL